MSSCAQPGIRGAMDGVMAVVIAQRSLFRDLALRSHRFPIRLYVGEWFILQQAPAYEIAGEFNVGRDSLRLALHAGVLATKIDLRLDRHWISINLLQGFGFTTEVIQPLLENV